MLVYPSSSSAWSASMEYRLPSEHPMSSLVSVSGNLFFTCAGRSRHLHQFSVVCRAHLDLSASDRTLQGCCLLPFNFSTELSLKQNRLCQAWPVSVSVPYKLEVSNLLPVLSHKAACTWHACFTSTPQGLRGTDQRSENFCSSPLHCDSSCAADCM